jgi:regulatory protein
VPILTGVAPDPRQPGYRLVEVDRGRFASLPAEALDALPLLLTPGVELSAPILARLQELADVEAACRAGVRALATRGRARRDLRRRLIQKQHPPRAVDEALARLDAHGLLDDTRFAMEYAARHAAGGRGPARLVGDLLHQGVDRVVAETAVREALAQEGIDPDRTLHAVATRRALQLAALAPAARKRRLLAYLGRRGYRGDAVRTLVNEVCGAA